MANNDYSHINLSYLQLMADEDPVMEQTLIEMLLEELPAELKKMKDHGDSMNWPELRATAHKMKSTLSFVGNEKLTGLNKAIERCAQQQQHLDEIPELLQKLENLIGLVTDELTDILNKDN